MSIAAYVQWLKRDWAKAGLVVSVFLFVMLFVFVLPSDEVVFLLLLQTPLYMLHQTEEYVFPGGFVRFFNRDIFKLDTDDGPVDEDFSFAINMLYIWVALPVCGLLATLDPRLGLWTPYFSLFAGVAHIALALRAGKLYNPGLVVSLLLNIPVGVYAAARLVQLGALANPWFNVHLLIGLGFNLLLPVMGVIKLRGWQARQV